MEVAIIHGAMAYFTGATTTGLAKLGSVLTTILLVYATFPIAHIIRARGESLGASHNGMVSFIFKDFKDLMKGFVNFIQYVKLLL